MTSAFCNKAAIAMTCLDQLDYIYFPCLSSSKEVALSLKKRSDNLKAPKR